MEKGVDKAMSHYIGDIMVDQSIMSAEEVIEHLRKFGLITKPAIDINNKVLGLKIIKGNNGNIEFRRGEALPEIGEEELTRRDVFSICGKLG